MPLRPYQPTEAGCIEVVFHFTLFGIPLAIVIAVCLDTPGTPTDAQLTAMTTKADNWMEFQLMTVLSKDLLFLSTVGTDTSTETGHQVTIDHGSGVIGSIDAASLPSQLAQVIKLTTALRGRSYRGRTFVPGIPVGYVTPDTQTLTVAGAGAIFTAYGMIDSVLAGAACHQNVLSRVNHGVRRPVALGNKVTGRGFDNTIETLRRRSASAHRS